MTMMNARVHSASRAWGRWATAAMAALAAGPALAVNDLKGGPGVNQLNLHEPVTRIAHDQMWLHNFVMIVCLVIFVAVFGVMFYSIFKHRKSKGAVSANFHESVAVEIAWTVVPFLIVIGMALPATKVVVAMKDTTNADLTIKATGYQWKWGYDYLKGEGEGIGFLATLDTAQRECPTPASPSRSTTTCSRSTTRWSCRWTRRSASSRLPTMSSTPGWCRRLV
jgi:cytochrome c oxidase subunit 2